jgi:hypothetical protein
LTEPDGGGEDTERRRRQRDETSGQLARFRRWSTRPYINPRIGFRAAGRLKTETRSRKPQTVSATAEIPAEAYDHAAAYDAIDSANPYWDFDNGAADELAWESGPERPGDDMPPPDYASLDL